MVIKLFVILIFRRFFGRSAVSLIAIDKIFVKLDCCNCICTKYRIFLLFLSFFSLTSCSSSIFVECHSKNSDFSFWIQTQRKIILETKKTLFLHRRYTKYFSLAHIHFFVFYVWEEEVLDTAEKIVSHLKFGFLLLTFKKICLTTLDWDDQLQSFFLHIYCHIWYQFQHHILWLVFIFVTFSLGTAAQKKFTRKRVFKGNFV